MFGLSPTSIVTPLTPLRIARGTLMTAWSTGDAAQAANALLEFAKANEDNLRTRRPEGADVRAWASRVSDWLFNTDPSLSVTCLEAQRNWGMASPSCGDSDQR